ncbi:inositol monophosphatase family protein [Actinoplanes couchii]|uniref:Inositol phosphatase n=1 Tax=Actinoplanes couchii TaxID=403638 RepID=A0ABQ3X825_9ACTN|nr:inositol monophosphatase [Actinoplanes couchii]MDR6320415.1 myo-inositol-1(or 4)-monophosphatase [Actinoplanes couchii]GID54573.1 inositol phosphatase [Actinoplanes couchii]
MNLSTVVTAVRTAGTQLLERWSPDNRPEELYAALRANDDLVTAILRPALLDALPGSGWEEDEHATGPIAAGDQWVVDPVGGNMNLVHGMTDWNIGVALVRDGRPVLGVLHLPQFGEMYTATDGGGAFLNDVPIRVSAKTDLGLALTGTGQAQPGRGVELTRRFGDSITAMMRSALYVRSSVPVGHQLAQVAAGRMDVHWQFENVRSHIGPVLLAREAGATVTDLDGTPWEITSSGYVAAAPGVHDAALTVVRGAL